MPASSFERSINHDEFDEFDHGSPLTIRTQLGRHRDLLHHDRHAGAGPREITERWAGRIDQLARQHLKHILRETDATELLDRMALVAIGGIGRRDSSPFSDVDLMLLHEPDDMPHIAPLMRQYVPAMFDAGLQLSHCVRTAEESSQLALAEPTIRTSLVGCRLIWGSEQLFEQFTAANRQTLALDRELLAHELLELRREERCFACPTNRSGTCNIKLSPGGLRDVHTLWWAGWLLTDSARVTNLSRFAPDIDARQLARTEHLYWQLVAARLDFHFHHQTCNDFFSDEAIGIGASHESLRRRVDFGKIAEQMRQVAEVYERLADRILDTAAELV